jgi:hypothetical protein
MRSPGAAAWRVEAAVFMTTPRTRFHLSLWQGVALAVVVVWALLIVFVLPKFGPRPMTVGDAPAILPASQAAHGQAIDKQVPIHALKLDPEPRAISLHPLMWVDPTGRASLDDARARLLAGAFKPAVVPRVDGFNPSAYWYVMHWRRTDAAQMRWLLTVGQPYLDDVQVHVERAKGEVQRYQMGDRYLAQGRPIDARWHAVGINLDPNEEVVVWVRVASGGVLSVDMRIDTPAHYFAQELRTSAVLGVFMGILLLAVFTYLIVGLWLRDGLLLAYAAFQASLFMLYMGQNGLLIQLAGSPPWWLSDLFAGVGSLGPWYAGNVMWASALGLAQHRPRLNTLYLGIAAFFAACLPLVFTPYYGALSQLSFLLGLAMSPLTLSLTWLAWRRERGVVSVTYMVAMTVYLLGVYITLLYILRLLPTNAFTQSAQPVCSLLHTLIMGVALAMRIGRIRQEKAEAEQRALALRGHAHPRVSQPLVQHRPQRQLHPGLARKRWPQRTAPCGQHPAANAPAQHPGRQLPAGGRRGLLAHRAPQDQGATAPLAGEPAPGPGARHGRPREPDPAARPCRGDAGPEADAAGAQQPAGQRLALFTRWRPGRAASAALARRRLRDRRDRSGAGVGRHGA